MPTFVSNCGKWEAAKEKINLIYKGKKSIPKEELPQGVTISGEFLNPGDPFIYDGPDREALRYLHSLGEDHLGMDFRHNPEFLQSVRNMNFNSVDEYLKWCGYDAAKEQARFQEKIAFVKSHEIPQRVEALEVLAGGRDYTGSGNDTVGGFGEERLNSPTKKVRKGD